MARAYPNNLVLAGGGARCLWQLGFLTAYKDHHPLSFSRIAAVSAGALAGAVFFSNNTEKALAVFDDITKRNKRNIYLKNILKKTPVFPQAALYRESLERIFTVTDLQDLRNGPDFRVQLSRIPNWLGPKSAVVTAISCYQLDKYIFRRLHPKLAQKIGYQAEIVPMSSISTLPDLFDLILCSSATPPFTPIYYHNNQVALDGGFVDNTPMPALSHAEEQSDSLILLTRHYRKLPSHPYRNYQQPSQKITIDKWDYTNPSALKKVYQLGLSDGLVFANKFKNQQDVA